MIIDDKRKIELLEIQLQSLIILLADTKVISMSKLGDTMKTMTVVKKGIEKYGENEFEDMMKTAKRYIDGHNEENADLK